MLHPFGASKPVIGIVIGVNNGYAMLLGKTDVLVFTQQVFLLRMDVRVIEENGVLDAGGLNGFHHLTGTGSTAGVQQQFAFALRQVEFLSNQFRHFSTS